MTKKRSGPVQGRISRWAMNFGVAKGVFGGSRGWRMIFFGAVAVRTIKRIVRDEPDVVLSEALGRGHAIVITHEDVTFAEDRRNQRAARRNARRARRS